MVSVIEPVIRVAHQLQSTVGAINILERYGANVNVCQSSLCVNTVPKGMYTEDAVIYTSISVPLQEVQRTESNYRFMFQLNHKTL